MVTRLAADFTMSIPYRKYCLTTSFLALPCHTHIPGIRMVQMRNPTSDLLCRLGKPTIPRSFSPLWRLRHPKSRSSHCPSMDPRPGGIPIMIQGNLRRFRTFTLNSSNFFIVRYLSGNCSTSSTLLHKNRVRRSDNSRSASRIYIDKSPKMCPRIISKTPS